MPLWPDEVESAQVLVREASPDECSNFCSVIEVRGEVQRLEEELTHGPEVVKERALKQMNIATLLNTEDCGTNEGSPSLQFAGKDTSSAPRTMPSVFALPVKDAFIADVVEKSADTTFPIRPSSNKRRLGKCRDIDEDGNCKRNTSPPTGCTTPPKLVFSTERQDDSGASLKSSYHSIVEDIGDYDLSIHASPTEAAREVKALSKRRIIIRHAPRAASEDHMDRDSVCHSIDRLEPEEYGESLEIQTSSHWPSWLHPAFYDDQDIYLERASQQDLEELFYCLQQFKGSFIESRICFENTFGPLRCWKRDAEIIETLRAVGLTAKNSRLNHSKSQRLESHYHHQDLPHHSAWALLERDTFVPRYLGSFPSCAAFQAYDTYYKKHLPPVLYKNLNDRMLRWYRGSGSVDDYQLWGYARHLRLRREKDRPWTAKDLTVVERSILQHRIDQCATLEEAITVTEQFFGPLEKIEPFRTPKVDVGALWSPCRCSICDRSRKRIKRGDRVSLTEVENH